MYGEEGKARAAKPYVKCGLRATAAIRGLGCPGRVRLAGWHRGWQGGGGGCV